ncbi:MAG: HEPN domain-containing protein [Anaerolineae bacterium]|nr:HEPN domain-containing protein [Caldilineales bacterium]MDW8270529.1 HEPN domain-containing protein [Anaerolineae bacterium]
MREKPENEGRRWLQQARIDLKWCRHLYDEGAYYLVCFLAQQVAEKALKAFLYAQGEELVVGHSVRQLCLRAAGYDPGFEPRLNRWAILDSFYIPTRYPNGLPDDIPAHVYNRETAADALQLADEVVEAVGARLETAN